MQIDLIDFENEFSALQKVTSPKVFHRGKIDKCGVFSEQIFGCVEDYKCACGQLQGREYANQVCDRCGVRVTSSSVRLTTFAKIELPEYVCVANPVVMAMFNKISLKGVTDVTPNNLILGKEKAVFVDNKLVKVNRSSDSANAGMGPVYFKDQVYPWLVTNSDEVKAFDDVYGKYLFLKNLPILPPDTRPISPGSEGREFFVDEINQSYNEFIKTVENIKNALVVLDPDCVTLQWGYNNIVDKIQKKFEKKNGFLRSHVLGKRVDYSGRAVIAVDGIDLRLGWCKLPYKIAKEIYKPQILKELTKRVKNDNELNKTIKPNQLTLLEQDYDNPLLHNTIKQILNDSFVGSYAILNRQPSLHAVSIQAQKIQEIIDDDVIVIHPLITEPFNADSPEFAMLETIC